MHKLITTISSEAYPGLSVRVVKTTNTEFHVGVWHMRPNALYSPVELPCFRRIMEPSLYVHPLEVLSFVTDYATDQLHRAATYLTGTGEYYVD
jgi:hypothetical protein